MNTINDQALTAALGIDADSDSKRLATAIAQSDQYGLGIALLTLVTDLRDLVRFYDSPAKVVYADSLLAAVDSALEWLYDRDSARAKALAKQPKP